MNQTLKRTPLYETHLEMGAKMVGFGGWEMPLQYQGILAEHRAVRSRAGMFDVSHMSKFFFSGAETLAKLQKLVPSNLARLKPGQAQYTVLLNQSGGVIDDLIFYYFGDDSWLAITNAATKAEVQPWLEQHLGESVSDRSTENLLLAIQGAAAITILQEFVNEDLTQLKRFHHQNVVILAEKAWIARTGYTGEDGVEVMIAPEVGKQLWQKLLERGVIPCGLGCRDTLRLEAGMHLYGQELNQSISPLEADLAWLVHLPEKGDFIGRAALESQLAKGIKQKLVALTMNETKTGKNIGRPGYAVLGSSSESVVPVGKITSGTISPSLGTAIALAYVPSALSSLGQQLFVQIRDRACAATVVKRPHYEKKS
jgi:aminomethyltransferase